MEINLDAYFSPLEDSTRDLNDAAEAANTTLRRTEERLVAMNLGLEVWYDRPLEVSDTRGGIGPHERSEDIATLLGFTRVDGKWCLAAKSLKRVSGFYDGDLNSPFMNPLLASDPVALLKQSRSIRLNAVAALPGFLQYLDKAVREKSQEAWRAMDRLSG